MKTRLAGLEARQAALQRQIDAQSAELVPPENIRAVLDKILANNPRLHLIEMKTLPRVSISLEKEPRCRGQGGASARVKTGPAEERKAARSIATAWRSRCKAAISICSHICREIESLQVRMFWDRVNLSVTTYPAVTMRLVVYTISLDKVWLTV